MRLLNILSSQTQQDNFAHYGGGRWIRTTEAFASDLQSDPFGHSGIPPLKWPLMFLIPLKIPTLIKQWSWREESNPRPADYKSAALPTELRQHILRGARF